MPDAAQIIMMVDDLTKTVKVLKKQPGAWWEKLDKIVSHVVKEVENIAGDLEGQDKKALAEAVILELYFKHLNSKYIPDFIERPAARKLVGFMVDKLIELAVSTYNKTGVFKKNPS